MKANCFYDQNSNLIKSRIFEWFGFSGHIFEEKYDNIMQRPVQFNNVSRIIDEKAADFRIFQEYASQCEYNSGWNAALILSQTFGVQLMFHLSRKKIF